jgi:hypothetical protein
MSENVEGEESEDGGRDLFGPDTLLLVSILVVGIVGSGVARWLLGVAGYNWVGRIVFVLGYATMIFVLWYGWIRPLDIGGPS